MPVSVVPRAGLLSEDKLFVREKEALVPLKEWLMKLADDSILYKRDTSSITHYWYKRGGRKFRLMDLPAELRLMIFEYVVAPCGEVYPLSQALKPPWKNQRTDKEFEDAHVVLGDGYHHRLDPNYSPGYMLARSRGSNHEAYGPGQATELALLRVSRQVNAEALQAG